MAHLSVLPDGESQRAGPSLATRLQEARLQSDLGRQKTARGLLKQALTEHGAHPDVERLRALVELRDGRPHAALAALNRVGGHADDVTTLRLRAAALCRVGRAEDALGPAREALAQQHDVDTLTALGMAELVAGQASAQRTADEAVRAFPRAPAAHRLACLVALRQQRWQAAEQAARAASHCPAGEDTETLNNLSVALLAQGRVAEARGMMRSAWVASEVTEHAPVVLSNRRQLERGRTGAGGGLRAAMGSGSSAVLVVLLSALVFGLALRHFALPVLGLTLALVLTIRLRRGGSSRRPYRALPAWTAVTARAPRPD